MVNIHLRQRRFFRNIDTAVIDIKAAAATAKRLIMADLHIFQLGFTDIFNKQTTAGFRTVSAYFRSCYGDFQRHISAVWRLNTYAAAIDAACPVIRDLTVFHGDLANTIIFIVITVLNIHGNASAIFFCTAPGHCAVLHRKIVRVSLPGTLRINAAASLRDRAVLNRNMIQIDSPITGCIDTATVGTTLKTVQCNMFHRQQRHILFITAASHTDTSGNVHIFTGHDRPVFHGQACPIPHIKSIV